jgi:RNA-dependent RNA polymerase
LRTDEIAGLGFSANSPEWYGGKVEFHATLEDTGSQRAPQYKLILERAVIGSSCRFTRRFGSLCFLRVKIPEGILHRPKLVEYFLRPFVLNGQVFRSFFSKDDHVFLFKTNEMFKGSEICPAPGAKGLSLLEFLNWHNRLDANVNQVGGSDCLVRSAVLTGFPEYGQVGLPLRPWAFEHSPWHTP